MTPADIHTIIDRMKQVDPFYYHDHMELWDEDMTPIAQKLVSEQDERIKFSNYLDKMSKLAAGKHLCPDIYTQQPFLHEYDYDAQTNWIREFDSIGNQKEAYWYYTSPETTLVIETQANRHTCEWETVKKKDLLDTEARRYWRMGDSWMKCSRCGKTKET